MSEILTRDTKIKIANLIKTYFNDIEMGDFLWNLETLPWPDQEDYQTELIIHRPTGFYLRIRNAELMGNFEISYYPGDRHPVSLDPDTVFVNTQGEILEIARDWVKAVTKYLSDDWRNIFPGLGTHSYTESTEEFPFDTNTQKQILSKLEKIEKWAIENMDLTVDLKDFIKKEFETIKKELRKQSRKSWRHTAIGVLFSIITKTNPDPDQAKALMDLFRENLSEYYQEAQHIIAGLFTEGSRLLSD